MKLRSRFAPSPTGLLHIGNARSAVLNWAYIKNRGGELILRIDDTDIERIKSEYVVAIKEDLKWLGLDWSKSFKQSERKNIYNKKIEFLKSSKRLYPCFETAEELSLKRKSLLTSGKPPIYDRSSLRLSEDEIINLINSGKKPHWRFKLEEKNIEWNDLIKNKVSFNANNLSDPILIRENGSLLYHLPSVIDDIEEKITDIIRGEDHISNTAFHIQIFEALGSSPPNFGHHSLLTDESGESFGKRIDSLSISKLKSNGYENITLLNYLLSVGTSKNILKEKNIEKLIKNFNISHLGTSPPKFSIDIIKLINKDILMQYDFLDVEKKFFELNLNNIDNNFWLFIKNNINFLKDSKEWFSTIYSDDLHIDKHNNFLKIAAELLPREPFNEETWDLWVNLIKTQTGKVGKDLFMPLRLALTGKTKGPELKYLLPILSRKHVLKKLGYIE